MTNWITITHLTAINLEMITSANNSAHMLSHGEFTAKFYPTLWLWEFIWFGTQCTLNKLMQGYLSLHICSSTMSGTLYKRSND